MTLQEKFLIEKLLFIRLALNELSTLTNYFINFSTFSSSLSPYIELSRIVQLTELKN